MWLIEQLVAHLTFKSPHGDLTLYEPIDWSFLRRGAGYLRLPLVKYPAPRLEGSRDTDTNADAVCGKEIGRGALWTVYDFVRPSDKSEEPSLPDLVVKLCQPCSFQVEEDARVYGVYVGLPDKGCASREEIWALVMEKGEKLGSEDEILLDLQYHKKCVSHQNSTRCLDMLTERYSIMHQYYSLHSAGVLHGDVRRNNILFVTRRPEQRPSLAATHGLAHRLGVSTDFERSVYRHEVYGGKDDWDRRCGLEMELVRDLVMI